MPEGTFAPSPYEPRRGWRVNFRSLFCFLVSEKSTGRPGGSPNISLRLISQGSRPVSPRLRMRLISHVRSLLQHGLIPLRGWFAAPIQLYNRGQHVLHSSKVSLTSLCYSSSADALGSHHALAARQNAAATRRLYRWSFCSNSFFSGPRELCSDGANTCWRTPTCFIGMSRGKRAGGRSRRPNLAWQFRTVCSQPRRIAPLELLPQLTASRPHPDGKPVNEMWKVPEWSNNLNSYDLYIYIYIHEFVSSVNNTISIVTNAF